MPETIKKPAQKATVYTKNNNKINIKFISFSNKTYIF